MLTSKIQNQDGFTQHYFLFTKNSAGFTLMEIVVATVIFALVGTAMLGLFNYTLQINRRGEALRQATQSTRSLVETLVKEVRNGQIDYTVINGFVVASVDEANCPDAGDVGNLYDGRNIYTSPDTKLGIIDSEQNQLCFYKQGTDLKIKKTNVPAETLNPPNVTVENLSFYVRPLKDAYSTSGGLPRIQPFVTLAMYLKVKLPTGEQVPIYYQTTVSTNKYDIPH